MLPSAVEERRWGLTLVELVVVISVAAIIALMAVPLVFHGVASFVFLPRAAAVNHAGMEVMHQMIEGGLSHAAVPGPVLGLRFAARRDAATSALWCAQSSLVAFHTPDNRCVMLVASGGAISRLWWTGTCAAFAPPWSGVETLPDSPQPAQITLPAGLFHYYNQSSSEIGPFASCNVPELAQVRRVEVRFTVQTGSGSFDQGQAQQAMTSAVAIRVP